MFAELVPRPEPRARYLPIELTALEVVRGGEPDRSSGIWAMKSTQRDAEVRLPRPTRGETLLSMTLRVKNDTLENWAWLTVDDESTKPRGLRSAARDRFQINDLPRFDEWREVRLPVPPGKNPLILTFVSNLLGIRYEIGSVAWIATDEEPRTSGSSSAWAPGEVLVDPPAPLAKPFRAAKAAVTAGTREIGTAKVVAFDVPGSRRITLRGTDTMKGPVVLGWLPKGPVEQSRISGRAFFETPSGPAIVAAFDLRPGSDGSPARVVIPAPVKPATALVLEVWSASESPWTLCFLPE